MKKVMLFLNKYKILLLVIIIGVSLDLFSKWHVFENILNITSEDIHAAVEKSETNPGKYLNNARVEITKDRLYFTSVLNPGAFSGFLGGNMTILVILSFVAIFFLFWLFFKSTELTFKMQFLAGLIFAGAIGNMYDRIVFRCVRDFAEFRVPEINAKFLNPWNTFNVADTFISIGVFTFVAIMLFSGALRKPKTEENEDDSDLDNVELEKIDPAEFDENANDKYLIVFSSCEEFEIEEFVKPFAEIMSLHPLDSKRLLRKQQGFVNLFMSEEKAEKIKSLLETKIDNIKIVKAIDFPRLPRLKEVYYIDVTNEGLVIGSELAKGEAPIAWSEISEISIAFIPGKDDPILKEIKDRLAKSAVLKIEGISKDEKTKIYADILSGIEKISLWQNSLDEWFKIMDAEVIKEKKSEFPELIADIFTKSGDHYRINSRNLIVSKLGEKRTPNELVNTRLMISMLVEKLSEDQISLSTKFLTQSENDEIVTRVTDKMFFEFIADFENYLRWKNYTAQQVAKT